MEWGLVVVGGAVVWLLMVLAERLNFIRNELKAVKGQIAELHSLRDDLSRIAGELYTLSNYAEEMTGLAPGEVRNRSLARLTKRCADAADQQEAASRPDSD